MICDVEGGRNSTQIFIFNSFFCAFCYPSNLLKSSAKLASNNWGCCLIHRMNEKQTKNRKEIKLCILLILFSWLNLGIELKLSFLNDYSRFFLLLVTSIWNVSWILITVFPKNEMNIFKNVDLVAGDPNFLINGTH